jgi:hypothetical protein
MVLCYSRLMYLEFTVSQTMEHFLPLRFVVLRGPRGAVRASTLDELQTLLNRPWSPDEPFEARPRRSRAPHAERPAKGHRRGRDGRRNDRKGRRRR